LPQLISSIAGTSVSLDCIMFGCRFAPPDAVVPEAIYSALARPQQRIPWRQPV
jgi:hypothetical protein